MGNRFPLKWRKDIHMFVLDLPSVGRLKNYIYPFDRNQIILEMAHDILEKEKVKDLDFAINIAAKRFELALEKGICVHKAVEAYFKGFKYECEHEVKIHIQALEWTLKELEKEITDDNEIISETAFYNDKFFGVPDLLIINNTIKTIKILDLKETKELMIEQETFQLFGYKEIIKEQPKWKDYTISTYVLNGNKKKYYEVATSDQNKANKELLNKAIALYNKNEKELLW